MKINIINFGIISVFFGVAGALMGYGWYGTVEMACFCGGLGLISPVLLFLVLCFIDSL